LAPSNRRCASCWNTELGPLRTFGRIDLSGLRSLPVQGFEKHLVFYRPPKEGIEVVRVLHGARDLDLLFDAETELG